MTPTDNNADNIGSIPRYVPFTTKIKPKSGQGCGSSGALLPQHLSNALIDCVKSGDVERFNMDYLKYGVEARDVVSDTASFK